jgi:hypothetical protein
LAATLDVELGDLEAIVFSASALGAVGGTLSGGALAL